MSNRPESSISMEFREFYCVGDTPKKEEDPTDINSSIFNAKLLFDKSTKTLSIHQLVAQEISLVADIESLDNDMQTLVYDNYTKFLNASDLVITFGDNISVLESQVSDLSNTLTKVASHNENISSGLHENREKIQRLIGIQRLLERIKFISRLPSILKSNLQKKNFNTAVKIWIKVEKILRTQQRFPSFSQIYEESTEIMKEIKNKITEQMLTSDITVENSVNDGVLLVQLGTSLILICSQLIHHQFLIVDNAIDEIELEDEPFTALSHLNESIIDHTSKFITLYKYNLIPLSPDEETKTKAETILTGFANKFFERILPILPSAKLSDLDSKKLAAYIRLFIDLFNVVVNESTIQQNIHKIIKNYTNQRVQKIFNSAFEIIENDDSSQLIGHFTSSFLSSIDTIVNEFEILSMLEHKECTQMLVQNFRLQLSNFSESVKNCPLEKSLLVAIISENMANDMIVKILAVLSRIDNDIPQSVLARELRTTFLSSSLVNVQRFIKYKRLAVEPIVLTFYDSEILERKKTTNEISKKSLDLVKEINEIWQTLDNFLPKVTEKSGSTSSHILYNTPIQPNFDGVRDETYNHIDRLFTSVNRLGLSKSVGLNKISIFSSIVIYTMKTILEIVRDSTFTSPAFNQVQVDMFYIYKSFNERVDNQDLFSTIIEEIVNSAADRTFNIEPFELAVIKKIVEEQPSVLTK
ncbi:hypothetical protein TVAG_146270 [Trichomonas vaginalis G3]|uniref:Vacuolar protein sorting-associated protein 51 homolog n=1 Tax=Trichomonas vaginalis (strain ATCC PRA-98 / G3) TaxID=412133 RepID=A2FRD0_TRIV3|nr:endocytic recycling [Trichomonas vaginalis G3]EAX92531.1 hypothetical protein TVAG_146270 [Trichomonas vaginalis G3]KAI5494248.1 endocytic recycling [Trichomonas vaginalis G3]|eukprot:XP_001305461.1 hypothetical protein [Trichomonas vaginalis G3]